ncbi:hypothetical protein T484DRAFT_1886098, partial [Baffinella frigidus]
HASDPGRRVFWERWQAAIAALTSAACPSPRATTPGASSSAWTRVRTSRWQSRWWRCSSWRSRRWCTARCRSGQRSEGKPLRASASGSETCTGAPRSQ